jgi:hypothetical protein
VGEEEHRTPLRTVLGQIAFWSEDSDEIAGSLMPSGSASDQ